MFHNTALRNVDVEVISRNKIGSCPGNVHLDKMILRLGIVIFFSWMGPKNIFVSSLVGTHHVAACYRETAKLLSV